METGTRRNEPSVLTPFQQKREERNRKLKEEYETLLKEHPERSRMMVKEYLKGKYEINSDEVYYKIINGTLNQGRD